MSKGTLDILKIPIHIDILDLFYYMMFLLVLYLPPPYFEAEYCLFCGRRRVAVARYRMICLVLDYHIYNMDKVHCPEGQNRFI